MAKITSMYWHALPPTQPMPGDCYIDQNTNSGMIWTGTSWTQFSGFAVPEHPFTPPTAEQLEKYPSLKKSWEEFLVIKKLLGV